MRFARIDCSAGAIRNSGYYGKPSFVVARGEECRHYASIKRHGSVRGKREPHAAFSRIGFASRWNIPQRAGRRYRAVSSTAS
jgi:hypothetical protein